MKTLIANPVITDLRFLSRTERDLFLAFSFLILRSLMFSRILDAYL